MASESTKDDGQGVTAGRRDFLKAMTGASAAAAAAVVGAVPAEAETQAPKRESKDERTKARYQPDAPDVQAFYRTNSY